MPRARENGFWIRDGRFRGSRHLHGWQGVAERGEEQTKLTIGPAWSVHYSKAPEVENWPASGLSADNQVRCMRQGQCNGHRSYLKFSFT